MPFAALIVDSLPHGAGPAINEGACMDAATPHMVAFANRLTTLDLSVGPMSKQGNDR